MELSPGYRVPVPVIKPEPCPGMTGACSESTGRLTDDCCTDPFKAYRAFEPVLQEEDRYTGHIDSDRGIYLLIALPGQNRPVCGGGSDLET